MRRLFVLCLVLLSCLSAHAATFTVTSTADPGDGTCDVTECTLREAINAANTAAGADTITFASGLTGTIALASGSGDLYINDPVDIEGPGAGALTISGISSAFYYDIFDTYQ